MNRGSGKLGFLSISIGCISAPDEVYAMTAHQSPKAARAPLAEFPVSDKCLGETPHFEDAPAWIYNHDNPYLHGVYAPTARELDKDCLLYTSPSPRDRTRSRMPSSA